MNKENNKNLKIVLLGQQGCGKGTQSERLSKELNIPYFSTGEIFREEIKIGSDIGKMAAFYINEGNLVPDEVTNKVLAEKLVVTCGIEGKKCQSGFILDGYPRDIDQAQSLERITDLTHVLEIDISEKEARERILGRRFCARCNVNYHIKYNKPKTDGLCDICGDNLAFRKDSSEAAIEKRFEVYRNKIAPLVDYYERKGILRKINGEQPIDKVFEDLMRELTS